MKVRIHRYPEDSIPEHWNEEGEMNQWMGQIVTIAHIDHDEGSIYLEEDGGDWHWHAGDFAGSIFSAKEQRNPNYIFKQKWRFS